MAERPIIFDAESVRAIIDGRKTQTRRVVKGVPSTAKLPVPIVFTNEWSFWTPERNGHRVRSPFGRLGDLLWVRESWTHDHEDVERARAVHEDVMGGGAIYYRATDPSPEQLTWKSPIYMPRWASRITLEVTDVRVERLQEIGGWDAHQEGLEPGTDIVSRFKRRWDSLNEKRGYPWESNPFVWVVSFKVVG